MHVRVHVAHGLPLHVQLDVHVLAWWKRREQSISL